MKTLLTALALVASPHVMAQSCSARSEASAPRVVELYTSEGCSSCPPADRWLTSIKPGKGVIAAAFHVDYWNGLGWKDRFSSPAFTERQQQGVGVNGSRYPYTPQIVVDGRDWRGLSLPASDGGAAPLHLMLSGSGAQARLRAEAGAGAPARIALWWARVEDGHESRVKAGENRGETLRHDHVVRDYARLPAWDPRQQPEAEWTLQATPAEAGHASRWIAVATDAANGRVLQALELGC